MEGKTNPSKLLLIDDDKLVLESFKAILRKEAYQVFGVKSGTEALELLKQKKFDLILVDLMMEDMDGLDILKEVKRIDPHVVVVIVTGFESMESALEAMRFEAYDYLIKPCAEIDLKMTVKRGLEKQRLENRLLGLERLAAITETAIETSREIDNPLRAVIKELKILLDKGDELKGGTKEVVNVIMKEAIRIKDVMEKMTHLTEPVVSEYISDVKMIDVNKSKTKIPQNRNDSPDQ
jgi:YesN/AraC family two-component response regulator